MNVMDLCYISCRVKFVTYLKRTSLLYNIIPNLDLWDELACLVPLPHYSCEGVMSISYITSFNHLMQFLVG